MANQYPSNIQNNLSLFEDKEIRKSWHQNEWWFSIVDVVDVLTKSPRARKYWSDLKNILLKEGWSELSGFIGQLKLKASDGKMRLTDCANTEGIFRIIQSIPSRKAEPFKLWLAKVGYERVQEIEDPERAQERMRKVYQAKGYSNTWIEKRIRGIVVRDELTNEWKQRGVKQHKEFAILTAEISKATFGMIPSEYKQFKELPTKQNINLRDHMDDLELIFTMLGEASTTKIAKTQDAQGLEENEVAAKKGGAIAGDARIALEKEIKGPISKKQNYFLEPEKVKRIKNKKLKNKI